MVTNSDHCYSISMARHITSLQGARPVLTGEQDPAIRNAELETNTENHMKQVREIQLSKDKIRKLKERCEEQKKKIKALTSRLHRQGKSLTEYKMIMDELKGKEYIVIINTNK